MRTKGSNATQIEMGKPTQNQKPKLGSGCSTAFTALAMQRVPRSPTVAQTHAVVEAAVS